MQVEGQTIYLEPGEKVTIEAREKKEEVKPKPADETTQTDGRLSFWQLLDKFNEVLTSRGYKSVKAGMYVCDYLFWAYNYTKVQYEADEWMFRAETYPLIYDYRGNDASDDGTAYNALQSWLMAMELAELVPDSGTTTNTQTELFKLAYEIGGGRKFPLYNWKSIKADPYAMREVAGVMYAICRGDSNIAGRIDTYRKELGGSVILASSWDDLGFKDTMLTDGEGRRGYRMDCLGLCVNTRKFLPDAPGPRVPGTTVCDLLLPYEQGQPTEQFNLQTQNYSMDEIIYNYMVREWNMMSQTPLSVWDSYPLEKKNRLVNVAAIPPCTYIYMFGKKRVKFDGIINRCYGENPAYDYYCFSETNEDTGLVLDGPFSDLEGIYRYNANPRNAQERFIEAVTGIADNMRWPTQDPNYGRCRPGCKVSRTVEEKNPVHGAADNEIYNVDLCVMVADDAAGRAKREIQDGFAADAPRSYVSGHSAQIWALALSLVQMNNEGNCQTWIRKAFEYSVNRSVGRFHWNSDCIYGRLFGAMTLPIVNAMSGLRSDYESTKAYVLNPQPAPQPSPTGNWDANVIIKNEAGIIVSTGEVRLYVGGHDVGINVYLPGSAIAPAYTIASGENDYSGMGIRCMVNNNGSQPMTDDYDGRVIDAEARIYLYSTEWGHVKSEDAKLKVTLDTADVRCSKTLRKSGATYVLKITPA